MKDICDRIGYLVETEAGGNAAKFGRMIGFSGQAVRYVSELRRNKPKLEMIVAILQTFVSLSPDWLLFGKGRMYRDEEMKEGLPTPIPEWLLKRVEELAIENSELKKKIRENNVSKSNNNFTTMFFPAEYTI